MHERLYHIKGKNTNSSFLLSPKLLNFFKLNLQAIPLITRRNSGDLQSNFSKNLNGRKEQHWLIAQPS